MPTLILTPRFTDDTQALWAAAGRLGWQVERLSSWRVPEHLRDVTEPVLYAEALFGPSLAEGLGIQIDLPSDDWLVQLPRAWRLRDIRLTTLAEARALEQPAFVKPPNDKTFPAAVYAGSDLPSEYDGTTPVLVSDVVEWEFEFRCFVLDRSVRTWSLYARDGELQRARGFACSDEEAQQLSAFMLALLADTAVSLPRAAVLDVGRIRGAGWAVVEQNPAWGAGIYGCDPEEVLRVIRHAGRRIVA